MVARTRLIVTLNVHGCLVLLLVEIWFQILLSSWFSCSCILLVQLLGSYFRPSILSNCEFEVSFPNLIKVQTSLLCIFYDWPEGDPLRSKHIATFDILQYLF